MAMATQTLVAAGPCAGFSERIQKPARLGTPSSRFPPSIHCFWGASQSIAPLKTRASFESSVVGDVASFTFLHKGRKRRFVQNFDDTATVEHQRRIVTTRAAQGDALGNSHMQFSSGSGAQDDTLQSNHIPIYVMLPLDTVTMLNTLKRVKALQAGLRALKLIGVDGVLMHVWWGVVEGESPKSYNWSAYLALVNLIESAGLKVQASVCFHGCSKLTDSCIISLPPWILSIGNSNPDIFYTDRAGNRFTGCLSLAVDSLPLLGDRSPMQMYTEFLESFRETFSQYLGNTIVEIIMGLGPDGELRYPSYQNDNGLWRFPGVGEFQCYDKYMLESLRNYAEDQGKPDWGQGGPEDAPSYDQSPNDGGFFHEQYGSWKTPYGNFFLSWYSGELLAHGNHMLSLVSSVFRKEQVVVVGKVPGIHWWYRTKSHAAELTAGYYNIDGQDGYDKISRMFTENSAMMILPCMEMSDKEQPSEARCSPEMLLLQIRKACSRHGVPVAGQNSLPRFDQTAYTRMKNSIYRYDYPYIPRLAVFTFLQMGQSLFFAEHWRLFVNFVKNMDKDVLWGGTSDGLRGRQKITFQGSSLNQRFQVQY